MDNNLEMQVRELILANKRIDAVREIMKHGPRLIEAKKMMEEVVEKISKEWESERRHHKRR